VAGLQHQQYQHWHKHKLWRRRRPVVRRLGQHGHAPSAARTRKRYTDRGALHPQPPQPQGNAIQTGERCTHRRRNHREALYRQGSVAPTGAATLHPQTPQPQGSAIQAGERCTHSRRNHREALYRQGSVAPTGAATTGKRYTDRGALHPQVPQPHGSPGQYCKATG